MDPEAALNMAESAVRDGEWSDAREYLGNYKGWRRGGGFQPAGGDARAKRISSAIRAKSASKLAPNKGRRKARLRRNADGESGMPNWLLWGGLFVGGYLAYRWWFSKPAATAIAPQPQPAPKAPPQPFQPPPAPMPAPPPPPPMPSLVSPPAPAPRLPSNSAPDDDVKYDVEDYVEDPPKGSGMGNYYEA